MIGERGEGVVAVGRATVRRLVESSRFQGAIIAVIAINAITLGFETSDAVVASPAGGVLEVVDRVILGIFVIELALRIYAHGWRFFKDPWNLFDLAVVGAALVPATARLSVLRALRILRALRLVSAVRGMKRVVGGLLASLPGMGTIVLLLLMVLYVGSVLSVELYGQTDPEHFGDLGSALFTLFQVMTGEAWPDIAAGVMVEHPSAWIFFVAYILISTFVVLNLFTAVVVTAMEPEQREEREIDARILAELAALRTEIEALRAAAPSAPPASSAPSPRSSARGRRG